jgi:4-azaleucine resistance transporter AzlC
LPEAQPASRPAPVRAVFRASPILLVYFAFAIAIGISAKVAGLSFGLALLMSVIIFGGSTQMVTIPLLTDGSPILTTVITAFLMNLRLLIWSMALAPSVSTWKTLTRIIFGSELTDETFALHSTEWKLTGPTVAPSIAVNVACHLSHCLGTAAGYIAGSTIPDFKSIGLDFVLAPLFIALLVFQLKGWRSLLVAGISGILVLVFREMGLPSVAVILATLVASLVGLSLGRPK